jgi:hypothetical protein
MRFQKCAFLWTDEEDQKSRVEESPTKPKPKEKETEKKRSERSKNNKEKRIRKVQKLMERSLNLIITLAIDAYPIVQ